MAEEAQSSFDILGLSDGILDAVASAGYTSPTAIQAQAIPQILMGRDILGIAHTGTGKTASFTLPLIDILSEGRARARMPRTLIIEPTRELAAQVSESFEKYGKNAKLTMALLIGGVNFSDQEKLLDRGVDVLIATPGRLLDHFKRGKLLLNGIEILVVDEADRMLDMGFIPDVEEICSKITKQHQTLFFSATMPPPIERLTKQFLTNPRVIEVAPPSSTAKTIEQSIIYCGDRQKRQLLRALLDRETVKNGIIFCNRKRDVKDVFESLKRHKYNVGQLHGDMAQSERLQVLDSFKSGDIQLLVASDVAARGLDIADVSHVFNFDVPNHAEDYVHRIGRTGRAGRKGRAFTIARPGREDAKYLSAINNMAGEEIPVEGLPEGLDFGPSAPDSTDKADKAGKKPRQARSKNGETNRRGASSEKSAGVAPDNKPDTPSDSKDEQKAARQVAKPDARSEDAERTSRSNSRRSNPHKRGDRYNQSEDSDWPEKPVVGMGQHVPAFMLNKY